jgi:hypothetical protein
MIKITSEFLIENKFNKMNQHDCSFTRTNNNGIDIVVIVNDALSRTFLNGVYLRDIDAIKLNQLWILLTGRKENWFNYPLPCSLCGNIPDRYYEHKRLGGELFMSNIIECYSCDVRVIGSDSRVALVSWNLSRMGVFNE